MTLRPPPDLFDPLAAPFHRAGSIGQAVVLVHGFTGVPAHFIPLAEHLGDRGFSVGAPRLAGHGTSPDDMADVGASDWIASVDEAVDLVQPGHDRVHLVGLSMGGLLSIIVGARRGADTITTINSPIVFRDRRIHLARFLHLLRPAVRRPEEEPPDLDEEVEPYWLTYRSHPTRSAAELRSLSRLALVTARAVTCPTLVIQSLVDESVDPRSARLLADAFGAECRILWLERSIHNSLLDRERHLIHAAVLERVDDGSQLRSR